MKPFCLFWDRYGYYGTLGGPQSWNAVVLFFSMGGNLVTMEPKRIPKLLDGYIPRVATRWFHLRSPSEKGVNMCETAMFMKTSKTCWGKVEVWLSFRGKVEVWPLYQSLSFRDFWGLWRIKICSNGCKIARNHLLSAWFMVPMPGGPLGLNLANRCSRNFPMTNKPISQPTSSNRAWGYVGVIIRRTMSHMMPRRPAGWAKAPIQRPRADRLSEAMRSPGSDFDDPKVYQGPPEKLTHGRLIKMFLFQSEKLI